MWGLARPSQTWLVTDLPATQRRADDLPTGTVTFLFTDIEGSTRLTQSLADSWPPLLERHNRILRDAVTDIMSIPPSVAMRGAASTVESANPSRFMRAGKDQVAPASSETA